MSPSKRRAGWSTSLRVRISLGLRSGPPQAATDNPRRVCEQLSSATVLGGRGKGRGRIRSVPRWPRRRCRRSAETPQPRPGYGPVGCGRRLPAWAQRNWSHQTGLPGRLGCVSRSPRAADGVVSTCPAWMSQVPTASPRSAARFPEGEGSSAPVSAVTNSSSLPSVTSKISVTVLSRPSSASRPAWRSLATSATLRRRPWRTVAGFGHLGAAGVQRWDTLPLYETCPAIPGEPGRRGEAHEL